MNYRNTIQGEKGFEDYNKRKDFFIKWNHQNDAKLNPGTTFRALINAGTTPILEMIITIFQHKTT